MWITPYSQDDIEVLEWLKKLTTISLENQKDKLRTLGGQSVNNYTIDRDKEEIYENEYVYKDSISTAKLAELEKDNSYIHATFTLHPCDYRHIPYAKRCKIFDALWKVVFGEIKKEVYLSIAQDLPQTIYSIEIVRNFPEENRRETFFL